MVSDMETIDSTPDPRSAAADLDAIADAKRAIRDRPWPSWLYPVNVIALGGVALSGIIDSSMIAALVTLAFAMVLAIANSAAGQLIGAPFALPTSRTFRILAAVSAVFVLASLPARLIGSDALVIASAAAAMLSYAIGAVVHAASTRR